MIISISKWYVIVMDLIKYIKHIHFTQFLYNKNALYAWENYRRTFSCFRFTLHSICWYHPQSYSDFNIMFYVSPEVLIFVYVFWTSDVYTMHYSCNWQFNLLQIRILIEKLGGFYVFFLQGASYQNESSKYVT